MKVLPLLEEDMLKKMIDYHWNHAMKTSALPYKVLATEAFMSEIKAKAKPGLQALATFLA